MPDKAPLPALPMPRGVLHASMISASTMVLFLLVDWLHLPPIVLHCQSDQGRFVARMERIEIRDSLTASTLPPDFAALHPGYKISLPPPQRQYLLRRAQMRLVDHLAIDLHDT